MLEMMYQTIFLIRKMVGIGSGAERDVDDILLTRYACYLVAQKGTGKRAV